MGVHTWLQYPCKTQPADTELIECALSTKNTNIEYVIDLLARGTCAKSQKDVYSPFNSREHAERFLLGVLEEINILLHLRDDESDDKPSNYRWIIDTYADVHNVEWYYFKKFDNRLFSHPYNYTDLFRYRTVDDVVYLSTYEEAYNFVMTHDVEVYKGLTFSEMLSDLKKFFELHPNGEIMIG